MLPFSLLLWQWRLRELAVHVQRSQELQQVTSLLRRDGSLLKILLVQVLVRLSAVQHKIYGVFQRGDAAVVKVRGRFRDVSERRRLEGAGLLGFVADLSAAGVRLRCIHSYPDVVELLIGQQHSIVAV